MKYKKIYLFIMIIIFPFILTSCNDHLDNANITSNKEYSFRNLSDEYSISKNNLKLYNFDNKETNYVNVEEFIKVLDGFSNYSEYSFYKIPFSSEYNITYSNQGYRVRANINYYDDTISINSFMVFNNIHETSSTDYSYGLSITGNTTGGGETLLNLNGLFDIHYKDDAIYLPFSIANFLFCSLNYYNVYFNGDELIGIDTIYEDNIKEEIKKCSLNNTLSTEQSRIDNYNTLIFILNNFYGIKAIDKIDDYNSYIPNDIKEKLLSTDPLIYSDGYEKLMYFLDDPHTYIIHNSFYNDYDIDFKIDKTRYNERLANLSDTKAELQASYPGGDILYYSDTALIHFVEFKTGKKNEIYENGKVSENAKDYDSFYFMQYVLKEIKTHPEVENIIFDLTLSPGGNTGALYRTLGYLTNKDLISTEMLLVGNLIQDVYVKVDTNLDGNYYDNDSYDNYNWAILASNYTYSAANNAISIAKKIGITVMGEKTGGGEFAIIPLALEDGTSIYISGFMGIVLNTNSGYKHTEYGIEPDINIERENLYNLEYLRSKLKEN